jgi:hypothetical protein
MLVFVLVAEANITCNAKAIKTLNTWLLNSNTINTWFKRKEKELQLRQDKMDVQKGLWYKSPQENLFADLNPILWVQKMVFHVRI